MSDTTQSTASKTWKPGNIYVWIWTGQLKELNLKWDLFFGLNATNWICVLWRFILSNPNIQLSGNLHTFFSHSSITVYQGRQWGTLNKDRCTEPLSTSAKIPSESVDIPLSCHHNHVMSHLGETSRIRQVRRFRSEPSWVWQSSNRSWLVSDTHSVRHPNQDRRRLTEFVSHGCCYCGYGLFALVTLMMFKSQGGFFFLLYIIIEG